MAQSHATCLKFDYAFLDEHHSDATTRYYKRLSASRVSSWFYPSYAACFPPVHNSAAVIVKLLTP